MKTKSDPIKKPTKKSKATHFNDPSGKGPHLQDGMLYFGPLDLARYELAQAKVLNSLQAIGLKKAEIDSAKRSYEDHIRRINGELTVITQAATRAEGELRTLQNELQESYKLDFTQVGYDDSTGKISVLGAPVSEEEFLAK